MMQQFSLAGKPFIALNNLLKVEGWCESGALAKQMIDEARVMVDGRVERRKRCKIVAGQVVELEGQSIQVID
jgi:ribosome-associated protein